MQRVGFIATNSIRGGANRDSVTRIGQTGNIFMAWSDRPWILNGASVRVSIIGFDTGLEQTRTLDGREVSDINSDLTSTVDLAPARLLTENQNIVFMGDTKGGIFDISHELAIKMLNANGNPNGRPNSDVVVPWVNGLDIVRRPRRMWIIDFGTTMPEEEAALYELPFEYVRANVMPKRMDSKRATYRERWWIHMESRPGLRRAIEQLNRYIVTPRVSKYRLFIWLSGNTLPDSATFAFARDDDYFFGILHSILHELWSLRMCTWLGAGNDPRYTPTTTFETFPFPWPPGQEPADDPRVHAIAQAAKELVEKRDNWLNPLVASEAELKQRTLTNLYNARPTWLDLAHKKLDRAVLAAYGWSDLMTDGGINEQELLSRLLALNLERAAKQGEVQPALIDESEDEE